MGADFRPENIGRHQEGASEPMRRLLLIDSIRWSDNHVTKLVRQIEPFTFGPSAPLDHDHARSVPLLAAHFGGKAIDIVEIKRKHLDTAFFQKLGKLRNRIIAQAPILANRPGGVFRIAYLSNRVRCAAWLLPFNASHLKHVFHCEVTLQHMDGACF